MMLIDVPGMRAAASPTWQLLSGAGAVPRQLLDQLHPEVLTTLLRELSHVGPHGHCGMRARQADARWGVLLLLVAVCWDGVRFQEAGGETFFVELLSDLDPRVRHHAAVFLQQLFLQSYPQAYTRALRKLVRQAQQHNDLNLLQNAYMQVSTMLEMQLIDVEM
jgi:hypothetical protein